MSRDDKLVASAAIDNTVRVWHTGAGDPRAFESDIPGNPVTRLDFSPDATILGVLNGNRAQLLDATTGELIAGFELGENHEAMAFSSDNALYVGGDSGALRVIKLDDDGNWSLQQLWQGAAAISWLEASPRGDLLVVVDAENRARQFQLPDGQPGELSLQLPGAVSDVRFSPGGTRVMFRTSRWIHRAASSVEGLRQLESVYGPSAVTGSRIVLGASPDTLANRFYVPVARAGFVDLEAVSFSGSDRSGLFGSKDELIADWRQRLTLVTPEGPDE